MPGIALEGQMSTGHDCFPPSSAQGPYTTTSFIGGKRIQIRGVTKYTPHTCNRSTHPDQNSQRIVIDPGGSTFFFEGMPVAMIGDMIDCGDAIAEGAESAFTI